MASRMGTRYLEGLARRGESTVTDIKPLAHLSKNLSIKLAKRTYSSQNKLKCTTCSRHSLLYPAVLKPAPRHGYATDAKNDLSKTPLYDLHVSKKAKFVPFGGYSMPLYYDDLSHVESHHWTREKGSIFDVSHMYDLVL
jgi:aminomethyltransferase